MYACIWLSTCLLICTSHHMSGFWPQNWAIESSCIACALLCAQVRTATMHATLTMFTSNGVAWPCIGQCSLKLSNTAKYPKTCIDWNDLGAECISIHMPRLSQKPDAAFWDWQHSWLWDVDFCSTVQLQWAHLTLRNCLKYSRHHASELTRSTCICMRCQHLWVCMMLQHFQLHEVSASLSLHNVAQQVKSSVRSSFIAMCIWLISNELMVSEHTTAWGSASKTTDACWHHAKGNLVYCKTFMHRSLAVHANKCQSLIWHPGLSVDCWPQLKWYKLCMMHMLRPSIIFNCIQAISQWHMERLQYPPWYFSCRMPLALPFATSHSPPLVW